MTLLPVVALMLVAAPAMAAELPGGGGSAGNVGGEATISTWVIGAVNGGVSKPAGTTSCSAWKLFDGSNLGGIGNPSIINPVTGEKLLVYFRTCDGVYQFVYVGPSSPTDIARVAYQKVTALVGSPTLRSRLRSTR